MGEGYNLTKGSIEVFPADLDIPLGLQDTLKDVINRSYMFANRFVGICR